MVFWKRVSALAIMAFASFAAACDEGNPADVEDDPDMAVLTAVVHDSAAVLPPGRSSPPPADSTNYDGVATGSAMIEVYSDSGGWITLGEASEVMFDIYCEEAAVVHADASVDADTYSLLRLTLTDFETSILAGAVIEAVTYNDPFVVTFGDGSPVVVEKSVTPFTLTGEDSRTVLFDLNTELWLDAGVIGAGVVSAEAVESATNVIIR